MSSTDNKMDVDEQAIDEGLYSRQLYVLGHEAMKRMAASNVLIVGLKGLGAEIAKDVILAGVKSVTLYDPDLVTLPDLGTQFFLRPDDVGKPRAQASLARLSELNSYVPVRVLDAPPGQAITVDLVKNFQVIVLCGASYKKQLEINDWTHANDIPFISCETRGLFGAVFNDFGPQFTCVDTTGEQALTGMVAAIDKDTEGIVTGLDESRHGLEDGDYVTFSEVQGMTELNDCEPIQITVKGPYTFSIGDTSNRSDYVRGGIFTQVKRPKTIPFKSLRESLKEPEFFMTDFAKFERPAALHAGFQALSEFESESGRPPRPRNAEDAAMVFSLAKNIDAEAEEKIITELAYHAYGDLAPLNAVIGSFVAQEVLKACSSKFHPMMQSMYFDSLESMPDEIPSEADCQPIGSRYDQQIAVFGKHFQKKIADHSQFLVGAGAIGCEMLKIWSMMGLASGAGHIQVTDLDTIEKSNLNRQFLFRPKDLGGFKAEVAAGAVAEMNPDLQGKISPRRQPVGEQTEDVYDEEFFNSVDGVTNALDNVEARRYMDRRCVYYKKSLLESGTLGTKGNTQVVIPDLTESYSSSHDPPEQSIPFCTLRSFPNNIQHCVEWAKEKFKDLFVEPAEAVNSYLSDPNYLETTLKSSGQHTGPIKHVFSYLVTDKPLTFDECIIWARMLFEEKYNNEIQQLLYSLPKDAMTKEGQPFWSGPKRAPDAVQFNSANPLHLQFIIAAANLHAFNYGLKCDADEAHFKKVLDGIVVPDFTPQQNVTVQITESDPTPQEDGTDDANTYISKLPPPSSLAGYRLSPVEFEKDDDTNHHIDFITACANLRATNYNIKLTDHHTAKGIAGKIIPAMATTTSLVTGLICLELYKVIDGKRDLEQYKNGFVNLALPFFGFSEPISAPKMKYREVEYTLWHRIEFHNDPTLQEIVAWFQNEHKLEVAMVSQGVSMLWSSFTPKKIREQRLTMKFSNLVESVSKKTVPPHVKAFVAEVMVMDAEGEDIDVPWLQIRI